MKFTLDNPGGDVKAFPEGEKMFAEMIKGVDPTMNGGGSEQLGEASALMALAMANDLPLHSMISFTDNPVITRERLQMMVERLNELLAKS